MLEWSLKTVPREILPNANFLLWKNYIILHRVRILVGT